MTNDIRQPNYHPRALAPREGINEHSNFLIHRFKMTQSANPPIHQSDHHPSTPHTHPHPCISRLSPLQCKARPRWRNANTQCVGRTYRTESPCRNSPNHKKPPPHPPPPPKWKRSSPSANAAASSSNPPKS